MPSILPGYEYDIFISYRQKDNKYDGWVTEFVSDLKKELEATFKEDISVYFDINPHDGLLETHDVDASLKEKLKCLVFIPIISRTYCDPKSFAWEHEFKAFVELASNDQFGLKIKLPNGNVANRVLPIRIHNLDNYDIKLCESVLGGVLRGIEFIYKEPGVNRPLKPDDDEKINLNKTKYRNQINKAANAIKEIITGIGQYTPQLEEVSKEILTPKFVPWKNRNIKIIAGSIIALSLIVLGYFFVPNLVASNNQVEKSIAVLPFINDSPDQENTYFINGLMEEILNNLQKIKDFRVLSRTSTEQYRGSNKPALPKIAKELGVNYIVEGSGQKYGNTFRLRVQLIAANNEKHLWAESFEQEIKETKDIFKIQSRIAQSIAAELKTTITPEEKQLIDKIPTTNLTAYDFYKRGLDEEYNFWSVNRKNTQALTRARDLFKKALEYDSTFALAYAGLAGTYNGDYRDSVLILLDRALSYDEHLAEAYGERGYYYLGMGKSEQAKNDFDKALKYGPNGYGNYYSLGITLYMLDYNLMDLVKALEYMHKGVSLARGKELPGMIQNLADVYLFAGFPEKADYYAEEAFKLDGDSSFLLLGKAQVASAAGNNERAVELGRKAYLIDSTQEIIPENLAVFYSKLGQYKEALKYVKKYENKMESYGIVYYYSMKYSGYAYWQSGYKNEAMERFNKLILMCEESVKSGSMPSAAAPYCLTAVYAFTGKKEKAYENLNIINKMRACPSILIDLIKTDPMLNSIRNEPEFKQIFSDLEAKYQSEHERVRKWLEEQGNL